MSPVIRRVHCTNCSRPVDPNARCSCGQAHGRALDAHRTKTSGRTTALWQRLRAAAIQLQPWCTRCGTTADLTGNHLRYPALSLDDVEVLCRSCNGKDGRARQLGRPLDRGGDHHAPKIGLAPAVNAEWLKRQFANALKDISDNDLENRGGQLSLFPKAMPMALSLGAEDGGSAKWISTPKATRRHLGRARAIRVKHIHDSQQRLENFDENVAVIEPAFEAGCQTVSEALDWIARNQEGTG